MKSLSVHNNYKVIRWDSKLKENYQRFLEGSDPWGEEDVEAMNEAITRVIHRFAESCGLLRKAVAYPIRKSWIDKEYRDQRVLLRKLLIRFKPTKFTIP